MIEKVKSFTIDRTKWGNGVVQEEAQKFFNSEVGYTQNGSDNSYLLRSDGLGCCLGLYAKACGVKDEDILHVELPGQGDTSKKVDALFDAWTDEELKQIASINDSWSMNKFDREIKIRAFFKKAGIKVKFFGMISKAIKTMKDYDW